MDSEDYVGRKVMILDSGSSRQYKVCALSTDGLGCLAQDNVFFGVFPLNRLELIPLDPHYGTSAHQKGYRSSGNFNVHADEATEFFVFIMLQASAMFQNIPEPASLPCTTCKGGTVRGNVNDGGDCSDCLNTRVEQSADECRAELFRLLTVRGEPATGPCVIAAMAYYDAAAAWYAADKAKWDD